MLTKLLTTSGGGHLFPQVLRGVCDWFGVHKYQSNARRSVRFTPTSIFRLSPFVCSVDASTGTRL